MSNTLKDMTMSDNKPNDSDKSPTLPRDSDSNEYRQLATMIVDNLLNRAVSKANEHTFISKESQTTETNGMDFDLFPPAIQIDLCKTRTPSPEEESQFEWSVTKKKYRFKAPDLDQQSTSNETDLSINDFDLSEREIDSICKDSNFDAKSIKSINFDEIRDFAQVYVDNVISTAIEVFSIQTTDNKTLLKNSRSDNQCFDSCTWMARIRQVLRQLMRSSCLCKNTKQQFRQRKS